MGKKGLICACLLLIYSLANANTQIYRWVDAKGRAQLSDLRNAPSQAILVDSNAKKNAPGGNAFRFIPEADALLKESSTIPRGNSTALSAGFWNSTRNTFEVTSILRFDISALIAEVNNHPNKKIITAQLQLFANTTDKIYKKGKRVNSPSGHFSQKSDNAFHIKAVRNNWDEHNTTWQQYYSDSAYTPGSIRTLPSAKAEGSAGNNSLDYSIDLLELIQHCAKVNIRELTLELRLQRRASASVVAFYSKEAKADKRPALLIELK